jgi:hypothetical protein
MCHGPSIERFPKAGGMEMMTSLWRLPRCQQLPTDCEAMLMGIVCKVYDTSVMLRRCGMELGLVKRPVIAGAGYGSF